MWRIIRIGVLLALPGLSPFRADAQKQPQAPATFSDTAQRATTAFHESRFEDAARLFRQSLRLHPKWAEGWGYLAASEFNLDHFREAREAYLQTTVLTPKNGPSWAYLGFCEYELRDYRNAFNHLMHAQSLGLGSDLALLSHVHYDVAMLWNTAGQFETATKDLVFLAKAVDSNDPIIEATGLNVLRMPMFSYEIPAAKHALVMKAGEAGWNMNGGHVEEARKIYSDLLAAYPDQPNLHYAFGFVLATSDQEAGEAELEKELGISPSHVPAMVEAALLSLELGHLEKSENLARRAIALEPKNYAPRNILGRIFLQKGNTSEGVSELETAVKLAPAVAATHFNLGQAYQKQGKTAAAVREFAEFRKLSHQKEGQDAGTRAAP